MENLLKNPKFLPELLVLLDTDKLEINTKNLDTVSRRISDFNESEFNEFISVLFRYIFVEWEKKKNFETLRFLTELIGFVVSIAPPKIVQEIESTMRNSKLWHVKLMMHLNLFGEIEDFEYKTERTLPLELIKHHREGQKIPTDLKQRILKIKDEKLYKFCVVILENVFDDESITKIEAEVIRMEELIDGVVHKHGKSSLPRIKTVLNRKLRGVE